LADGTVLSLAVRWVELTELADDSELADDPETPSVAEELGTAVVVGEAPSDWPETAVLEFAVLEFAVLEFAVLELTGSSARFTIGTED
jgi:hypothetical protein